MKYEYEILKVGDADAIIIRQYHCCPVKVPDDYYKV